MPGITIGFGAVLCAIGLWGYFGAEPDKQSLTAFIPAGFGAALILCGLLAMKWRATRDARRRCHRAVGISGRRRAGYSEPR